MRSITQTSRGLAALALTTTALAVVALPASAQAQAPTGSTHTAIHSHGFRSRQGVVPAYKGRTIPGNHHATPPMASAGPAPTGPDTLSFQGGSNVNGQSNQAVFTSKPKVYLVFYGNQWGNQTTNAAGYQTFSGDPDAAAVAAQELFKGLGTNSEGWSGTMTQYCDGSTVTTGATVCPAGAPHNPYPTGGTLAGIWYDNAAPTPATATGQQLADEAVAAATHFGNTTAASNRNAMYMVLSPHGANPDNYLNVNAGCAWHSDAYDANNNLIPFTDQPYNIDLDNASGSCGKNFLTAGAAGNTDGYTITLGHEYAETVTDAYPDSGWITPNAGDGGENGDHCAWSNSSGYVQFSTGSVAMQPTWSNDTNECDLSHVTVGAPAANTVTVTGPGNQSGTVGKAASLQIKAADSAGAALSYSATGLPAGLSISGSGLISGTPTATGTSNVTVTAADSTGAKGTATFTWTVAAAPTTCTGQLLKNGGFESGTTGWASNNLGDVIYTDGWMSRTGSGYGWLNGYSSGYANTETLSQQVSIPTGCKATLSYYVRIDSDSSTAVHSTLSVNINGTKVQGLSNLNASGGYMLRAVDLSGYAGRTVTVQWSGHQDGTLYTSFFLDDTALTISAQ